MPNTTVTRTSESARKRPAKAPAKQKPAASTAAETTRKTPDIITERDLADCMNLQLAEWAAGRAVKNRVDEVLARIAAGATFDRFRFFGINGPLDRRKVQEFLGRNTTGRARG